MKEGQKGRWKHSCTVILYHHPTLIHISTIDQTLVKAFSNTGWITQGREIHLGIITILKTLESIKQEAKWTQWNSTKTQLPGRKAIPQKCLPRYPTDKKEGRRGCPLPLENVCHLWSVGPGPRGSSSRVGTTFSCGCYTARHSEWPGSKNSEVR